MRRLAALAVPLAALAIGVSVAAASQAQTGSGSLVGLTQISYGCPGPTRIGRASCESWHPFPRARFGIRQIGPKGRPLPQIIRVVVSDSRACFSVRLSIGDYELTPLVQAHTNGGRKLIIHVRAGHTTRILVRFLGVPRMV
jgi:hypothetical protein